MPMTQYVAGLLSLLFPGLGQAFVGKHGRGAIVAFPMLAVQLDAQISHAFLEGHRVHRLPGRVGHWRAAGRPARFQRPLIKPCIRFSHTRLSDGGSPQALRRCPCSLMLVLDPVVVIELPAAVKDLAG